MSSVKDSPSDQAGNHQLSLYKVFVLYWIRFAGLKLSTRNEYNARNDGERNLGNIDFFFQENNLKGNF